MDSQKKIELRQVEEVAAPARPFNIRRIFRRIRGFFPITWSGLLFVCLAYLVWFGEVAKHSNQILFAAVLWFAAAVAVIFVFECLGTLIVALATVRANREERAFDALETGQVVESGYRVYRPFYLPFIQVEIETTEAPYTSTFRASHTWYNEMAKMSVRGRYTSVEHLVTVRDLFGMFAITFPHTTTFFAEIKPATSHFESIQLSARTSGEGYSYPAGEAKGELVEMRRYQAGDPLRYVLWRVFARSRKLLVRAPEPAIVEEQEMFVYFIASQNDEPSASLTRAFLSTLEDTDAELHFCADGANRVTTNAKDALWDVVESVNHREHGAETMEEQARAIPQQALRRCFVMVPPQKGAWLDHVKSFCANTGVHPTFVMALEPEEVAAKPASRLQKLFCTPDDVPQKRAQRIALCEELSTLGAVQLIDVSSGAGLTYEPQRQHEPASPQALPAGGQA